MDNKLVKSYFVICGSCISFYIGAGFATMQEIMQYYVSYGSLLPIAIFVTSCIYIYTNISFAINGNRLGLNRGSDIYTVYGSVFGESFSRIIGKFFELFSALFCYMSFIVMCGGANATLTQQWHMQSGVGAAVVAILTICTVTLGLQGILKVLGKIGQIMIFMILVISIWSVPSGVENIFFNIHQIDKGLYANLIKQIGDGNPFASGASYGGFVILWFAAFIAEIGAKNKLKSVNTGMGMSAVFIFGTAILCCIALIAHIDKVAGSDIPALILAYQISPIIAQIFAGIIFAGIYTSAVPLLWTSVRKFAIEGSRQYRLLTISLGCLGCIIACYVPYQGLINILYGLNGYLGFILMFIMFAYDIKTKMSLKRE